MGAAESRVTNELTKGFGLRAREVRLAQRKTLADVAALAGLTPGYLSRVENGVSTASVAALVRICEALETSLTDLLTDSSAQSLTAAHSQPIDFGGVDLQEWLLTPTSERRIQAILSEIGPRGGSGDEFYDLPVDVEFVYVISGRLAITFEDHVVLLHQGDAFTFPKAAHHFRNADEIGTTKVLWIFSPALPGRDVRGGGDSHDTR
ncbi:XRE family transcriptional regulator [Streptomyces sp. SID8352]|uniref:helix-turn-helix domain-containing protein n=1 Tax=Streptomyces sp. SID8352 TaxID=2690338 RepID=UPI001371D1EB|nr:XRE family transcriptional regulator [Streptomyces sp. SID8352]MYU22593.1 helix-turn-helix domain-containing protein [Streptomyces sp. SID8352]